MVYLTGDLHGDIDIRKLATKYWPLGKTLTKQDYLIILGDFGLLWNGDKTDAHWLKWLDAQPWTTLWLDGNHENFDMIDALPGRHMFNSTVGVVNESVFHLRRGHLYNIEGNTIFTLGGAQSIDKAFRKEGKSWWPGELLSGDDIELAWKNLLDVGMEVDYVLTHTCPTFVLANFGIVMNPYGGQSKATDPVSFQLQDICDVLQYKHWYFGHMHENRSVSYGMDDVKFTCLYENIIELGAVI
jgi:hypothetical protein